MQDDTPGPAPVQPTDLLGLSDPNLADEQAPVFDLSQYVPPTWDVFEVDPHRIAELLDKGMDPQFARVRLTRTDGGPHDGRIAGEFDPWLFTTAWLLTNVGPGRYDVKVLNKRAQYITGRRVQVGGGVPQQAPQPPQHAPQSGAPPWGAPQAGAPQQPGVPSQPGFAGAMLGAPPPQPQVDYPNPYAQPPAAPMGGGMVDQMMAAMIQRMVNPPADPMRDSMAKMLELMALGMQNSQQTMQQIATMQASQPAPANNAAELLAPMVTTLIGELGKPREAAGGGGGGDAQQLVGMLTMGMQLRDQINGDDNKWLAIVPQLVDSVGPGIVAAFASATIKDADKSQAVLDTINEHMRARSAEATGEVDESPIGAPGALAPGGVAA